MRILHLIQRKKRNKISYLLSMLLNELKKDSSLHNIVIHPEYLPQVDRLKDKNLEIEYIDFNGIKFFKKFYRIYKYVLKKNIKMVHCHDFISSVMIYCISFFIKDIKVIWSRYDELMSVYMTGKTKFQGYIVMMAEKMMFRKVHCILTFSENIRNQYLKMKFNPLKIKDMDIGIEYKLKFDTEKVDEIRKKYIDTPDKKMVCMFGQFERLAKGFDIYMEVVKQYKRKTVKNNLIFAVCGSQGEDMNYYLHEKQLVNDIVVIESFYTYEEVFPAVDIVIVPSRYDNISVTVIESIKYNKPVIISISRPAKKYIEDGRTGFLVKTGDCKGFVDRLILIEENDEIYEKLVSNLKEKHNSYPVKNFADEIKKVYNC